MAKRHESSWEKLSNVSLVIHAFIGLLARGTYSRAIVDSWESDALCSSILLSLLQTFDAKICIFSNNFAGNVFRDLRSTETLNAALSSTIALERVARGKSLIHAWIRNGASKSVSQHDSWLFAAFPEHESQNSHYNETCVHPVYLENQFNKAKCTYKGIPLFVPFLYGYRGNSPLRDTRHPWR